MIDLWSAALELIREGDIIRTLAAIGRDCPYDHRAHYEARQRFDRARRWRR